jgi:hypothetical protein
MLPPDACPRSVIAEPHFVPRELACELHPDKATETS